MQKVVNKKGQAGLDFAFAFIIGLLTLVLVGIAFLVIGGALQGSNIAPAGSAAANGTTQILNNGTLAVTTLFSSATTWMVLIGVVILILIIVLVIRSIRSIRSGGS